MTSTGVNSLLSNYDINIFYFSGNINITRGNYEGNATAKVYNIIGEEVFEKNISFYLSNISLNFENREKGIYIVKIELQNGESIVKKIAVN
jgi:hypothetical protein